MGNAIHQIIIALPIALSNGYGFIRSRIKRCDNLGLSLHLNPVCNLHLLLTDSADPISVRRQIKNMQSLPRREISNYQSHVHWMHCTKRKIRTISILCFPLRRTTWNLNPPWRSRWKHGKYWLWKKLDVLVFFIKIIRLHCSFDDCFTVSQGCGYFV